MPVVIKLLFKWGLPKTKKPREELLCYFFGMVGLDRNWIFVFFKG